MLNNVNQDSVNGTEQLDEQVIDGVQETPVEEVQETTESQEVNASPTEENYIEIDGEKYTLDDIKEFKQGYLRQSDYTRKTQELARQRKENEYALELFNYLKANPYLIEVLKQQDMGSPMFNVAQQLTPEMQKIQELEMHIAQRDLDYEITQLKQKYPDFDEVKVLQEAEKRGITDLEFVYKALREVEQVDVERIKKEAIEESKKQILAEIEKNKDVTKTVINQGDKPTQAQAITLTPAQKRVAQGMGLTEEEYAEWLMKR
jgi:hypothetical protein